MSNSKLTPEQKIERKDMLSLLNTADGYIMQDGETGATAAIMPEFPGSRMVRVSFSFMSPDEIKFRRKVGEYWTMYRMFYRDEFVTIPKISVPEVLMAVGI